MQTKVSYIKENDPSTYNFFLEYWDFSKKYWNVKEDEDWWNCFLADLAYLVSKHENNDFFVALVMQMYVRNRDVELMGDTFDELKAFYKEWWKYINKFYKSEADASWWEAFTSETKELLKKYQESVYFTEIIDIFFHSKAS